MTQATTTERLLEIIADVCSATPGDLGQEWREFAEAVSSVIIGAEPVDIGRLVLSVARLP